MTGDHIETDAALAIELNGVIGNIRHAAVAGKALLDERPAPVPIERPRPRLVVDNTVLGHG